MLGLTDYTTGNSAIKYLSDKCWYNYRSRFVYAYVGAKLQYLLPSMQFCTNYETHKIRPSCVNNLFLRHYKMILCFMISWTVYLLHRVNVLIYFDSHFA